MRPELSQRVTAAWGRLRALGTVEADRYLRELRRADPEVARELDVLLGGQGANGRERAALPPGDPPRGHPPGEPAGHREPTVSEVVKTTGDWSPLVHESPDARVGTQPAARIRGRLELLRVVGRGAFGEVWQAYDPALQKHVAVKAPLPGGTPRPAAFLHEARKAASLRHPAIVQVYDVGESEDGWYIVSEFVEGDSLRDRMKAGRPPFGHSARIIATVAGALHAAHLAGLIHRDVKPANILLDKAGNAYLTDFGLALREEEQPGQRSTLAGTLAYMSPEQIRGDTHLMDGRADIYSLGAVLYELLTGRPLCRARNVEEYQELILRREPRPPRSIDDTIPEELERISLKCLAKEVRDRYRTAQDVADDLGTWLAGDIEPRPAPPTPAPPARTPGWRKAAAAALILFLAGGALGVAVLSGAFDARRPGTGPPGPLVDPAPRGEPSPKVPVVKELIWPKGRDLCKWEVLPETNQLRVYTDTTALLQVGETNADSWVFTATFRQLADVGRIGLFLGHRKDPRTGIATFEVIRVLIGGGKVYLQRRVERYRFDAPFAGLSDGHTYRSLAVKDIGREPTIRLVVRGNRLREVWLNGTAIPSLVNVPLDSPAAGAFGVFNENSDGVFSKLLFNGDPIPLLADAGGQVPEKP